MAVTLGDVLFGVAVLSGVVLCALGVYSYRRWREPGVGPFAASTVVLGLTGIAGSVVGLVQGGMVPEDDPPLWASVAFAGWSLAMVPWVLFALQYTGRYTRFRRRTVGLVALPAVGVVLFFGLGEIGVSDLGVIFSVVGTLSVLYVFALSIVGCYLLVRTTSEYGHLSLAQGACLTFAGLGPLVVVNSIGVVAAEASDTLVFGTYSLTFLLPAIALVLAVFRYRTFDSTPAVGALGERAIPRETDDLVFVTDRNGRVITINETATERLEIGQSEPLGSPFEAVVGTTVADLAGTETVELETAAGKRKFDPQVTPFTDQHDRELGHLVSLRDVTERELRKQRLEVLNRVLRHNLRNRVDVIKGNAEAIDGTDSDRATAIRESADGLASLSAKARATDTLVSRPATHSEDDLVAVVRDVVATHDQDGAVTLSVPERAPLVTDWEALRAAVESAVENAVEHADASVTVSVDAVEDGCEVVVADDGPGIPDSELASIDAESETPLQHGTGLGLWQLKWAVTKLNGDLAFETEDGTTVTITVPDQS